MTSRELDRFSFRYFNHSLSKGQEIRFWKAIASRRKMADRFIDWCELESGLVEHFKSQSERNQD